MPLDSQTTKIQLALKLKAKLMKDDKVPVTTHQKRLLYRVAVCPKLNWDLMVNDLPMSWIISTLEAEATRLLKKWVELARPADSSTTKSKGARDCHPSVSLSETACLCGMSDPDIKCFYRSPHSHTGDQARK